MGLIPVKEGQTYEVTIMSEGKKRDGVTKINGYVIIIPEAKLYETCKVRITKTFKSYGFAEKI